MYSAPRNQMVSGRIPEYLDNLKGEFETLAHDVNMYKMQRDDYERKLQTQLTELTNIQQTLFDLERNHTKIKQQYEEEIMRLRRQLELQSGSMVSGPSSNYGRSVSPGSIPAPTQGSQQQSTNVLPSPGNRNAPSLGNNTIASVTDKGVDRAPSSAPGMGTMFPYPPSASASAPPLAPLDPNKTRFPPTSTASSGPTPTAAPSIVPSVANAANTLASIPSQPAKRPRDDFPSISGQPPTATAFSPNVNQMTSEMSASKIIKSDTDRDVSKDRALTSSGSNAREGLPRDGKVEDKSKSDPDNIGSDWIVGYNPGVQTSLNIDLMHTLEHNSVVCCVKFSSDGKNVATGCNKTAQIYSVETGEKVHTFSEDTGKDGDLYIRSVCFSPDNRYLAAGAEDKTVKLWDIETKRLNHTFVGHDLDIYSLDFSRDGRFIVSGSGDKKAKIWDVEKGECLFTLGNEEVGPKDGVTSVAFSPDGRLVAAGSLDRIVRLWDAQTGYFLERYEGHLDSVYSVAFSPDGRSLASGSLDKTLKLWDLSGSRARSRCRSNFSGHKDFVLSVAFSPDGNWLISGSKDRSVQFWDPKSAVSHMMLQGHKNSVISVAVSPQGGYFATGSGDFRARIWKYEQ